MCARSPGRLPPCPPPPLASSPSRLCPPPASGSPLLGAHQADAQLCGGGDVSAVLIRSGASLERERERGARAGTANRSTPLLPVRPVENPPAPFFFFFCINAPHGRSNQRVSTADSAPAYYSLFYSPRTRATSGSARSTSPALRSRLSPRNLRSLWELFSARGNSTRGHSCCCCCAVYTSPPHALSL